MKRLALRLPLIALLSLPAVGVVACGSNDDSDPGSPGGDSKTKLSLVAYSTPQEAYEEIIPAFQKTAEGKGVTFTQSYGASGDQSRAVQSGLPADVVALSLEPDVDKLVDKDLVDANWKEDEFKGNVTNSVVVFAVRKGNPKKIKNWDDLVKPGVEVITPNPFTSGGARWNIMAAYGSQIEQGKSKAQAVEYLRKLFKNVPVQDKTARESLQTFVAGKGDVLLAYENEAITAQDKDQEIDYVLPKETILIENPVAVVKRSKSQQQAQAFVDYLRTAPAQKVFAEKGYRPVLKSELDEQRFPEPDGLFTIEEFGGWSKVTDEFFDPNESIVAEIQRSLGVTTQ